ncbi:hypothetical protein, partial [Bacteroides acidifaciens]|uniref:hypothetical protein n=1 Tax=Bacteroides acidifaciens TaxID=85831 RepID=UPI0025583BF3
ASGVKRYVVAEVVNTLRKFSEFFFETVDSAERGGDVIKSLLVGSRQLVCAFDQALVSVNPGVSEFNYAVNGQADKEADANIKNCVQNANARCGEASLDVHVAEAYSKGVLGFGEIFGVCPCCADSINIFLYRTWKSIKFILNF